MVANPVASAKPAEIQLELLTPSYRGVIRLDETAMNPFRTLEDRADLLKGTASQTASGPDVAGVLAKYNALVLTGVIPSSAHKPGLIVLGGQVFKEGESLTFPSKTGRTPDPFLEAHKVSLSSVTKEGLVLTVSTAAGKGNEIKVPINLASFSD